MKYQIPLATADIATTFAADISRYLRGGDCLLLSGVVGAGKTHFARSLIQSLMVKDGTVEDVPSPTFTLVQVYETSAGEVWHSDLYRLSNVDEVIELGLEGAFDDAITLVEWPDRLGPYTPARHLALAFTIPDIDSETRVLTIDVAGPNWQWLGAAINNFTLK